MYPDGIWPDPAPSGFNASPAGNHSEGQRSKQRHGDITKGLNRWQRKRLASPGNGNYAFESLGLVEFTPIGAGVWVRNPPHTLAPQSYYYKNGNLIAGLGGLTHGQIVFQPLGGN